MSNTQKNDFELIFLGTCAADFSKKLQDECRDCFDKDARRSSAMLINGRFLLDCGVHTLESLRIQGVDPREITDVFITHLHGDHFRADHIEELARDREEPLRLWVHRDAPIGEIANVTLVRMEPLVTYDVDRTLSITGLPANHAPEAFPQHFLFQIGEKKVFYGCDGAWFLYPTYRFLRKQKLSLAVLDCTVGDYGGDFRFAEHNSIPMIRLMLPSLRAVSIIDENTQIFLSHLAPSLHKSHAETVEIAREFGAQVAYDGLRVVI